MKEVVEEKEEEVKRRIPNPKLLSSVAWFPIVKRIRY